MWFHIKDNVKKSGIYVDFASGYEDHCHCLVSMNASHSISYVVQMLKGESAKWMNDSKMINDFFDWQKGYFTVGVSESNIPIVRNYLEKQENHHKNYTWKQERKELIEKFGFVEYSED